MIVGRKIEGDDFHQGRENAGHGLQPTYFRVFRCSAASSWLEEETSQQPGLLLIPRDAKCGRCMAWDVGQLWPRLGNAQDRARQPGLFGLAGEASRSGGAQAAPCALSQENKLLEGRPVPGSGISVALPLSLSAAPAAERTFLYNHRKHPFSRA
jgi:hypothetical protein